MRAHSNKCHPQTQAPALWLLFVVLILNFEDTDTSFFLVYNLELTFVASSCVPQRFQKCWAFLLAANFPLSDNYVLAMFNVIAVKSLQLSWANLDPVSINHELKYLFKQLAAALSQKLLRWERQKRILGSTLMALSCLITTSWASVYQCSIKLMKNIHH